MIPEIKAWINGDRDYKRGLILYQKFGAAVEHQKVVADEYIIMQNALMEKKLWDKIYSIWKATKDDKPSIVNNPLSVIIPNQNIPTNNGGANASPTLVIEKKQNTNHKDNGTVNLKLADNSIMKIHLRLVEKVNGRELLMGGSTIEGIGFVDFLKMLYSGVKCDLIVCSLNKQQKKGGERMSLKGAMSTVSRPWIDRVFDDSKQYSKAQQKLMDELRNTWLPWWAEMCNLHSKLKVLNDKEERYNTAFRIADLELHCRKCWDATDYVKTWSCLPKDFILPSVPKKVEPTSAIDMLKRLKNVEVNVCKYRKALKLELESQKILDKKKLKLAEAIAERNLLRLKLELPVLKDELV